MSMLLSSLGLGLVLALLAVGIFISFRVLRFADVTVDGSFALGGAAAAATIAAGGDPWLATAVGLLAGAAAGAVTGALHVLLRIDGLLSGIIVMTALYSVNLRVMGRSNIPLVDQPTVVRLPQRILEQLAGGEQAEWFGRSVSMSDAAVFVVGLFVVSVAAVLLRLFLATNLGGAMRATGDNPTMMQSLGVPTGAVLTLGLALANALAGAAGAMFAQAVGFADAQMGVGILVTGLASVIIGENLVGRSSLGVSLTAVVLGSVIFRLLVAIALRVGLDPNDLKLITAVFVAAALALPRLLGRKGVGRA